MKVVETLLVRDEVDIVDAQIAFHLNTGVDFVIATDHESRDGTTDVLEAYARLGYLRRIPERGPVREDVWRTRMARLAATEHGADWVLNMDADEFWVPRGGSVKELFGAVPMRFGVVGGLVRHFVPPALDATPFYERMTLRVSPPAALNDPTSPWRPGSTVAHRAIPDVTVFHASYAVAGKGLQPVADWYPFDILHFPYRSVEQWLRKTTRRAHGDKPLGIYVKGDAARALGRVDDAYASVRVDDVVIAEGLEEGRLVVDTRVRDVLRALEGGEDQVLSFRTPASTHGIAGASAHLYGQDAALTDLTALQDATLVRFQRRLDDVNTKLGALERRAGRDSRR